MCVTTVYIICYNEACAATETWTHLRQSGLPLWKVTSIYGASQSIKNWALARTEGELYFNSTCQPICRERKEATDSLNKTKTKHLPKRDFRVSHCMEK